MTTCLYSQFLSCAASPFILYNHTGLVLYCPVAEVFHQHWGLLCTKPSYFSITQAFLCFQRVPKACVLFSYYAFCDYQFSKNSNSCCSCCLVFSFFFFFQFLENHSMFLPNLEHHQAQRSHEQNLVSSLFLYLLILTHVSYGFYCDQWSFRFMCIPWAFMLEHSLRDKIQ